MLAAARYAGADEATIVARCGVPRAVLYDEVTSTLDVASALAQEGAPEGTLVLAERQTAGRGRAGRTWASEDGAGIWSTLIARPADDAALEVLSLRVGLALAGTLDPFADDVVRLKWPNDLIVSDGKLGGILIESRWREDRADWVAIGVGINCRMPADFPRARALRSPVSRIDVLAAFVPAVRAAVVARGSLAPHELQAFARRDWALGKRCTAPAAGIVGGIDARGALLVRTSAGDVTARSGSLVLEEDS
jgi:BirA family biotin operon repressor/biotin-[acetyl-CoA-carboxylase] ligase